MLREWAYFLALQTFICYFHPRKSDKNTNFVGFIMYKLNLPEYSFTIKTVERKQYIFDSLRKKYVRLTPEEWVRQNFIYFLVKERKYPPSLIAVEAGFKVNKNPQRADMVVFNRKGNPVLIAEFKTPEIKISQQTFDQIVRYNMSLKVKFLIVSNGLNHYCCSLNYVENTFAYLQDIPDFSEILSAF